MTTLNPYLCFRDRAGEAIEFYQSVFGGDVTTLTYADGGGMGLPETLHHLVMHAELSTPDGHTLMCTDTPQELSADYVAVAQVALSGDAEDGPKLRMWFDALAEGGQVHMPIEAAPWGDAFGQCADRFGHLWLVNIAGPRS